MTAGSMGNAPSECFEIYCFGDRNTITLSRTFTNMFDDDYEATLSTLIKSEIHNLLDVVAIGDISKLGVVS